MPVCWGRNHTQQLGRAGEVCGDSRCLRTPQEVVALGEVVDIGIGSFHACVLRANGAVACLGADHDGQLGSGGHTTEGCAVGGGVAPNCTLDVASGAVRCEGTAPVAEHVLPCAGKPLEWPDAHARALAVGGVETCALLGGGGYRCAGGDSLDGLVALPDRCTGGRCAHSPAAGDLAGVTALGFGTYGFCALLEGGGVRCSTTALKRLVVTDATALAVGEQHACAIRKTGALVCAGWNAFGQVGTGAVDDPAAPPSEAKEVLPDVVSVAAADHTCAVDRAGAVFCWGANDLGQLGLGDTAAHARPEVVAGLPPAVEVVVGQTFSCARGRDASVHCWGGDQYRELGVDAAESCTSEALGNPHVPCSTRPLRVR